MTHIGNARSFLTVAEFLEGNYRPAGHLRERYDERVSARASLYCVHQRLMFSENSSIFFDHLDVPFDGLLCRLMGGLGSGQAPEFFVKSLEASAPLRHLLRRPPRRGLS